ncbi:GntR family transcriptional regulator [Paenibacillus sp. 1_12]|uniref:GntR family transcriptional regulator n=1 Tax=Paenibacillus sp. 1_12 TaxID=1566278 RepID=UPI0008F01A65|nr:GntR family transcriptional regulator [Paenibacillus sp. 1_12]SFL15583.1 GntR family transcriptional regulator [Paenibacillus sp. 1_12]
MDFPIQLTIDPTMALDANIQVKEQLKWLIGIGHISPGELLPSTNDLAAQLGLNRNTINLVYHHLQEEGIVSMHKGRGTLVLNSPQTDELRLSRSIMHDLLERTIDEIKLKSINVEAFFTASLAYGLMHGSEKTAPRRLLFVECKEHDHPFYSSEIQRVTGAEVKTIFLEDIESSPITLTNELEFSSMIVTTLNHHDQVRQMLAEKDVKLCVIGALVETSTFLDIAKLTEGCPVTFVCLGKAGGQWMAKRVHEAGIHSIKPYAVGIRDHAQLLACLEKSERVYASTAVYSKVKELEPDKVSRFPMQLEKSSEALLRDFSQNLK